MAFVVGPGDERQPHGVLVPAAAREQVAGALGVMEQRFGCRRLRIACRQQVVQGVEAAAHLRHRDPVQPPRRQRLSLRILAQRARFQHQSTVVVEQFRHRVARLVADRREPVEGRHGGVHPVGDGVVHVRAGVGDVVAGGVAPQPVQREQAHVRGAVAGAFQAAAAGQLREIGPQRRHLFFVKETHPVVAAAGQRPVQGRLDEAVVIIVAGVVDRPAGPRPRASAPVRAEVVPDVPHRLFGERGPSLFLRVVDLRLAGVEGHRQRGDARADFQIRIAGDLRRAAVGDGGFGVGDFLFDHGDREVAVFLLRIDAVQQRRVVGGKGVARLAGGRAVDPALEARELRRPAVDVTEVERNPGFDRGERRERRCDARGATAGAAVAHGRIRGGLLAAGGGEQRQQPEHRREQQTARGRVGRRRATGWGHGVSDCCN